MSKASIYDRLQRRPPAPVEKPKVSTERSDFRRDRLRVIDGVALTPAGLVNSGVVPKKGSLEVQSERLGLDGFPLLGFSVQNRVPAHPDDGSQPFRRDDKALRLTELIQSLFIETMELLDNIPEHAGFDIVLVAPLRLQGARDMVMQRLRDAVLGTEYGERLGALRYSDMGWDPHASLAVPEPGGMAYVLWICADSVLNTEDLGQLQQRRLLASASQQEGVYPGEAVSALLFQRLLDEDCAEGSMASGWWLDNGAQQEHIARHDRDRQARRQTIEEILDLAWPQRSKDDAKDHGTAMNDAVLASPAVVVVDALTLPGRTVEVSSPLMERWQRVNVVDDGISVDGWCGWPGEALTALQLVLAVASLAKMPEQDALILNVAEEERSRALVLRSTSGTDSSSQEAAVAASADTRIGS